MAASRRNEVTYDGITYAPGAVFRVTQQATLDGYTPGPLGSQFGWSQPLPPGSFVTCTGYGPGGGADPGCGVEFTSVASQDAGAFHCRVSPGAGSVFDYRPAAGLLLRVQPRPGTGLTDLTCPPQTSRPS